MVDEASFELTVVPLLPWLLFLGDCKCHCSDTWESRVDVNLLDIVPCLRYRGRVKGRMDLDFQPNMNEVNADMQERVITGRGANARFKPCVETETWKYSVVLSLRGERVEEFPAEFTALAEAWKGTEGGFAVWKEDRDEKRFHHKLGGPLTLRRLTGSLSSLCLAILKPEIKSQKPWLPLGISRNKSLCSWTLWELRVYERLQYRMSLLLG